MSASSGGMRMQAAPLSSRSAYPSGKRVSRAASRPGPGLHNRRYGQALQVGVPAREEAFTSDASQTHQPMSVNPQHEQAAAAGTPHMGVGGKAAEVLARARALQHLPWFNNNNNNGGGGQSQDPLSAATLSPSSASPQSGQPQGSRLVANALFRNDRDPRGMFSGASSADSAAESNKLRAQLRVLKEQLATSQEERLQAVARAEEAERQAQAAREALSAVQSSAQGLSSQYSQLREELDAYRARQVGGSSGGSLDAVSSTEGGSGGEDGAPPAVMRSRKGQETAELEQQVRDLQAQLEDLDYRLSWALRDLRAHQLVLRAQGELNMHLSGLPPDIQQSVFDQVDAGAELLGDGGSATVHEVTLNGSTYAVKVMPLFDINTARPYHFRDICTTFLRHQRSPYIELPLHTFLRLKDHPEEGTQYFLYTLWPRRHMDVDQLLCRRSLTPLEILTIMQHTVLALYDLAVARLVHADVKPPNVLVMLDENGQVATAHLTDFGSVQFVAPGLQVAPAIWDGQLAWNWPPEQRDVVVLEACDVWGLALLYSCMKVRNPTKDSVTSVLQDPNATESEFNSMRDTELLPILKGEPDEVVEMTRLMRRCVVRDPQQRPSLKELVAEVSRLRESLAARSGVTPGSNGAAVASNIVSSSSNSPAQWQAVGAGRVEG